MFFSAFFSLGLCLTYTIESLFSSTSSAEWKYWESEWPSFQRIGVSLRQRRLVQINRHRIRWPALGICYDSIATYVFTDNCFLFTSMLADALRSMDVSRYPDSLTSYPRLPYHAPLARVLICFLSVLHVSSYLYCYGLSTRLRLLACLPFPLLYCRLVHLHFSLMPSSFRLVDSSMLTITAYAFPFVVYRLVSRFVILGF